MSKRKTPKIRRHFAIQIVAHVMGGVGGWQFRSTSGFSRLFIICLIHSTTFGNLSPLFARYFRPSSSFFPYAAWQTAKIGVVTKWSGPEMGCKQAKNEMI